MANKKQTETFSLKALILGVACIICWQLAGDFQLVPAYLLPTPVTIAKTIWLQFPVISLHLTASLLTALSGLLLATVTGIILALVMELHSTIKRVFYPYLVISQSVPVIFIFPLLLVWFGFGFIPRLIIVTLICFFPLVVSLSDAMERTPRSNLIALQSIGASSLQLIRYVRFPLALPAFFSGLRIAATYSVMGAVIAEWLGASKGLGVYMLFSYKSFLPERVFAAIVVTIALTLVLVKSVRLLHRLVVPWQP